MVRFVQPSTKGTFFAWLDSCPILKAGPGTRLWGVNRLLVVEMADQSFYFHQMGQLSAFEGSKYLPTKKALHFNLMSWSAASGMQMGD